MSGLAGGGGSFPSATAGADQVFALLALLGDDRKFKQRLTELKQAEDAAQAVIAEAATLKGEVERAKREVDAARLLVCLLYTSPSPRDGLLSRMPSSA